MLMNKDLLIDGKVYISATRASKRVGYAPDYIGQLARANKISGRLIGKTWYVELDSLLNHKKTRKLGKRKKSFEPVEVRAQESVMAVASGTPVLTVPFLPSSSPVVARSVTRRNFVLARVVASALMLFVVTLASFAYFEEFAPTLGLRNSSLASNAVVGWVENIFGGEKESVIADESLSGDGIVVLPESKTNDGVISQIKNAFSDGVNVSIDKENDSGVITPVFKEGGDYEDYAFVLVPVEDNNQ